MLFKYLIVLTCTLLYIESSFAAECHGKVTFNGFSWIVLVV